MTPTNDERRDGALRLLERGLMALATLCLAWAAFVAVEAHRYQRDEDATLQRMRAAVAPASALSATGAPVTPGDLIGSLTVPRLHLTANVREGDDEGTLSVAIGHLPDTPAPWQSGNAAVAGHRETFFRPLKDIVAGDEIQLVTPKGDFRYDVRETAIVEPDDVSVLSPTERPSLTLITCYPFSYVGHAPRRFIVHAERRQ